jgi:Zn-dependent M28 family amino/carboxypeptidase
MLIARLLRDFEFADTIRFVHFSGEEQGQWGSRAYAAALSQDNEEIKGFINLDMIGYDGNGDQRLELHTGLSAGAIALGEAFAENNDDYTQGLLIERKTTSASRFSDHSPFWDAGVPAFLAIEDFFDNSDAGDRDRNPQYHRSGDTVDLVDLDYVMRTTRTTLATVAELAGLLGPRADETPTVTLTPTASATPTVLPVGCANLLVNGDFEGNDGWQFGTTPFSAGYDNSPETSG